MLAFRKAFYKKAQEAQLRIFSRLFVRWGAIFRSPRRLVPPKFAAANEGGSLWSSAGRDPERNTESVPPLIFPPVVTERLSQNQEIVLKHDKKDPRKILR